MDYSFLKKKTVLIPVIVVVGSGLAGLVVHLARARSRSFRESMDKILPTTVNPWKMANIVLNAKQEEYVRELHPAVQDKFRAFIKDATDAGWNIIPTSGYRSFQKQLELHKANSSNAKPGKSHHNYGLALDINATNGGTWLRKSSSEKAWNDSGLPTLAKKHGISWQYAFGTYKDPVHFYVKHDTTALLAKGKAMFGSEEKIIGNQIPLA